jgi:FAD/FMN-containing dehydrogenase
MTPFIKGNANSEDLFLISRNLFRNIACSVEVMKERLGSDIIRCVGYGHIGDGNMHLNITSKEYSHAVQDKIEPFLYKWTSQQHGSISAEHGITFIILVSSLIPFLKSICFSRPWI